MNRILSSLLLVMVLVEGCTHKRVTTGMQPASGGFITYRNLVYGADTIQQSLDVSLPVQRDNKNTPVIIVLHGGAWITGDKSDFITSGFDTFFTSNGCAVVFMNYRLDSKYAYPAPVDDIGLVMDYVSKKAGEWQVNPDRVCLFGKSSGAQLAMLYAYSRNNDHRIKAVVDCYGPANLTDTTISKGPLAGSVTVWLGPDSTQYQKWHDASPVFFLAGAVPTVIVQGTLDALVNPVESEALQDSLLARGEPCLYINWTGSGHGWDGAKWNITRSDIMAWVKQYL